MTEERKKEWAEECYGRLPAWDNKDSAIHIISVYLRTVAAEAWEEGREEGIEEMRDRLLPYFETIEKEIITEEAARLKGKGKE